MIKSNVLCNLFHELGYVFTLLTVKNLEIKLNNESFNFNINHFKTNDDCHYFASKTIQYLESVITYLEKPFITLILKQKTISTYAPELKNTLECKLDSTVSKCKIINQIYKNKNLIIKMYFFIFFNRI